jgi:hypothetical protein
MSSEKKKKKDGTLITALPAGVFPSPRRTPARA